MHRGRPRKTVFRGRPRNDFITEIKSLPYGGAPYQFLQQSEPVLGLMVIWMSCVWVCEEFGFSCLLVCICQRPMSSLALECTC